MKTSNNASSEALKGVSNTMQQLVAGICQSIQVLSQALAQPHAAAVQNPLAMFPHNHQLQQQNLFDYISYFPQAGDVVVERNGKEDNNNSNGTKTQ